MIRSAASKVMWVGRATVFLVGLAVILALVFGVASTALGKNGNPFILGKANNVATQLTGIIGKVTTGEAFLVKNPSGGEALGLSVGDPAADPADKTVAPMKVDSQAEVSNLNAALAGRADSAASADTATTARNADMLDNKDSSEFASNADASDLDARATQLEAEVANLDSAEPWHEAGAANEPAFQNGWTNLADTRTATAAFYKDPWGVVHLKGTVRNTAGNFFGTIFTLPCGYGPNKDQNFGVVSYGANSANAGIVDVVFESCGDGTYRAYVNVAQGSTTAVSLNDITFRAHGS